ncbi:MAG: DUF3501 family protein [Pseudohongiella sp.]|uniref:DUF3501 family protein n=1 Tax=Pseudohongiella sp. TaxID=1979412 RepID=UPI0034A0A1E2
MKKLTVADIGSLDQYQQQRSAFRQAIIAHKRNRRIALGPNATLHFEDFMTMKYQVQEMMRAENLNSSEAIAQELAAYNPLIPDGSNLKCTFMLEYADENERRQALRELLAIEQTVSMQIEGHPAVFAITDEDLCRTTQEKTSAVHFMRFEFTSDMIAAAQNGAHWSVRCDHPAYRYCVDPIPDNVTRALCRDFGADKAR